MGPLPLARGEHSLGTWTQHSSPSSSPPAEPLPRRRVRGRSYSTTPSALSYGVLPGALLASPTKPVRRQGKVGFCTKCGSSNPNKCGCDRNRARQRVIGVALAVVANMRSTADRLEKAAFEEDFATLAEIQMSTTMWPLEAVRGAAWVLLQEESK